MQTERCYERRAHRLVAALLKSGGHCTDCKNPASVARCVDVERIGWTVFASVIRSAPEQTIGGRARRGRWRDFMDPNVSAVLDLIFRWTHVVAGIVWIGHLYFFNFVNSQVAKTYDADSKKKVVPELMPRAL